MNRTILQDTVGRFVQEMRTSEKLHGYRQDRQRRVDRAQRLLRSDLILTLPEEDLQELFFDTNAFGFWRNKAGEWNRRRDRSGLDGLKATLEFLIERAADGLSPEDLKEIRRNTGLGLLLSTELSTYRFPRKCWIYSARVTLPSLQALGCDLKRTMPYGQKSDPYLYAALGGPMAQICEALTEAGMDGVDHVLADLFLWWVRTELGIKNERPAEQRPFFTKTSGSGPLASRVRDEPTAYQSGSVDVLSVIQASVTSAGLRYSDWQIAAFYTALQVKGFVILSGISGTGKTRLAQHFAAVLNVSSAPNSARNQESNWLFVPVRPEWRDSKSLLGYYNPLTARYEWTLFLRFLLRAARSYEEGSGRAYFVILDEMNLARVEYYFADLLSVLESGRDKNGWTREPLRFHSSPDAAGELPPLELPLPPNLYFVGTVNTDETTHAFSPKVLDRAFALPLAEVSFSGRGAVSESSPPDDAVRQELLREFTLDGLFPRAGMGAGEPPMEAARRLQALNELLRPHHLHFGYRVFDEIISFLEHAARNRTFADEDRALDAAILMKALPKFHGSRTRLEGAIRSVLAWTLDPDNPDHPAVQGALRSIETQGVGGAVVAAEAELGRLPYHYPLTAGHARRMLGQLFAEGFAAFG